MEAVVEFHGFKDNHNRFVVKELAVVNKYFQSHVVFQAPYSFKNLNSKMRRTARWLSRHFHHIKWDDDGIPYDEQVIRDMCSPFSVIHTRGSEKAEFLREFHPNVREIVNTCVDKSSNRVVTCIIAKHNVNGFEKCALRSAEYYTTMVGL